MAKFQASTMVELMEKKGLSTACMDWSAIVENGDVDNLRKLLMEMVKAFEKEIKRICTNTANMRASHFTSVDDIFQEVILHMIKYPKYYKNLNFFFSCVKNISLNAIRKEARRSKKFKAMSFDTMLMDENLDDGDTIEMVSRAGKTIPVATFEDLKEMKWDIANMVDNMDEESQKVYDLMWKDYSMKEIDAELDKRCDRKYNNLKKAIRSYYVSFQA